MERCWDYQPTLHCSLYIQKCLVTVTIDSTLRKLQLWTWTRWLFTCLPEEDNSFTGPMYPLHNHKGMLWQWAHWPHRLPTVPDLTIPLILSPTILQDPTADTGQPNCFLQVWWSTMSIPQSCFSWCCAMQNSRWPERTIFTGVAQLASAPADDTAFHPCGPELCANFDLHIQQCSPHQLLPQVHGPRLGWTLPLTSVAGTRDPGHKTRHIKLHRLPSIPIPFLP